MCQLSSVKPMCFTTVQTKRGAFFFSQKDLCPKAMAALDPGVFGLTMFLRDLDDRGSPAGSGSKLTVINRHTTLGLNSKLPPYSYVI